MPETFGGGVPFSDAVGEDIWFPKLIWEVQGVVDTTYDSPVPHAGSMYVLTALDVVSLGGTESLFEVTKSPFGTTLLALNFGSNVDSFSWRGMWIVQNSTRLHCSAIGDVDFHMTAWGWSAPDHNFTD